MTTSAEFAKNFSGQDVPPALAKLLSFQDENEFESYAEGFGLLYDDKGGLRSWSTEPGFLDALMPFAQATGGGSFYALWNPKGAKGAALGDLPVVVFGDEGGAHVVAENVDGLLRILSFDVEPSVSHEEVYYYKSADYEPRENAGAYKAWLKEELGLEPADDADAIVKAAQAKHQAAWTDWFKKYEG